MPLENVIKASTLLDANSYASFYIRERSAQIEGHPTSFFTLHDCLTVPLGFNTIQEYTQIVQELQSVTTILKSFIATRSRLSYLQTLDIQNLSKEFASPIVRLGIQSFCYFHHNVEMSMGFNKLK